MVLLVHLVVLFLPVVGHLPSNCLIFATSRLLLVLGVPVDGLHHNVVPVLRIDPVVRVDVVLEGSAEDPPLHKIKETFTKLFNEWIVSV